MSFPKRGRRVFLLVWFQAPFKSETASFQKSALIYFPHLSYQKQDMLSNRWPGQVNKFQMHPKLFSVCLARFYEVVERFT